MSRRGSRILPTPAAHLRKVGLHVKDMVIGTVTPNGPYMCIHYRALSGCGECGPLADQRLKRDSEQRRRAIVGRE